MAKSIKIDPLLSAMEL